MSQTEKEILETSKDTTFKYEPERCHECGVIILETEKLPEGRENEVYYCPKCESPLGVGFKVTKVQDDE